MMNYDPARGKRAGGGAARRRAADETEARMSGEAKRLAEQHERAYAGPAWSGPAVIEVLRGVNAHKAFARPIERAHSIVEIVLHLATWEDAVARRIGGEDARPTDAEDWPVPGQPGEAAWKRALSVLEGRHHALQKALAALPEDRLEATAPGQEYTNYVMVQGAIQHLLYHAGQIAVLAKG
jgi:uncharacterized damage-inducible protein DinB